MKYFIDTEFIEGPQKEIFPISLFRKKTPPTIDLISIGIVAEDGRELYEISKDFNLKEAWNRFEKTNCCHIPNLCTSNCEAFCPGYKKKYWLRENVLYTIWKELFLYQECDYALLNSRESDKFKAELDDDLYKKLFTYKSLKGLLKKHGKTNNEIRKSVLHFTHGVYTKSGLLKDNKPEFYAYFADYDWVVFCWLFGKMINLPEGFPKYCNDLKQMLDQNKSNILKEGFSNYIKKGYGYPEKENEHNALADARWNKKLFGFLNKIE